MADCSVTLNPWYNGTMGIRWCILGLGLGGLSGAGCSLSQFALEQSVTLVAGARNALQSETDIALAEAALPATLKTVEGLLQNDPEHPVLLELLAEAYTSYAFGFLEDAAEDIQEDAPLEADGLRGRAVFLHLRARDYGRRLLRTTAPAVWAALTEGIAPEAWPWATVSRSNLAGLFWTAYPWAAAIGAGRDRPALLAQLTLVQRMLEHCRRVDRSFYRGGADFALGAMAASVPVALGGQPERARQHFEAAVALTKGTHLMYRVLYARLVGVQTGDRAFFAQELAAVLAATPDDEPTLALANRLAKRRAQRYLARINDLFL